MTRAELRRAQKESKSTTKTYNMTAAQLQDLEKGYTMKLISMQEKIFLVILIGLETKCSR